MGKVSGHILLAGYAKLPSNTTAQKMFDQMVVVADVDYDSGIVLDVDCSMVTELGRRFVLTMMKGYNLNNGTDDLLAEINLKYYGHLKKALLTAIREIGQQYADLKKENMG